MLGHHIYSAAMTITVDRDALFNNVYDTEHIPALERVPGVLGVRRYRRLSPTERFYLAVYEIADPGVPSSAGWLKARDLGRWPTEVRPFTSGLQNGLFSWHAGFGGRRLDEPASTVLLATRCLDAPDLDAQTDRIMSWLSGQPAVAAAAFYREHDGRPHLLAVAVDRAASEAASELARADDGPASLGPVETYAPIRAREG